MSVGADSVAAGAERYVLRAGDYEALVLGMGATLCSLTYRGRDLVLPFDPAVMRPDARGALLAPWPNRIDAGKYEFGGREHQLPINELLFNNTTHGLVMWQDFELVSRSESHVELIYVIAPQPGYPWRVRVTSRFELDTDGLSQEVTATNLSEAGDGLGQGSTPFGAAAHPYLLAGPVVERGLDEWSLRVDAALVTENNAREIPQTDWPVAEFRDGLFDFRGPRAVGDTVINNAFTGLARDERGIARVEVRAGGNGGASGSGVAIEFDERCPWVQVYTHDYPETGPGRAGLAVEPMTCPANAFNSGTDVVVIAPGESASAGWRILAL